MLKILNVPDKVLSEPAKPVIRIDRRLKKSVQDMEKLLIVQDDPPGVGLAAPQVGINLRFFIIKPSPKAKTEVFINPKIISKSQIRQQETVGEVAGDVVKKPKNSKLEGCLSIPRIWAPIKRQKMVKINYLNLEGEEKTASLTGFKAIIIQHEIDHLNGILFTQRALEQGNSIYEEQTDGKLKKVEY